MSIANYRSEASYAHSHRKFGGNSSKQVKLLRKATKDYHRAVRRAKKQIIAADIASDEREFTPVIGKPYHDEGWGWFHDDHGCWDVTQGRYVMLRQEMEQRVLQLLQRQFC